MLTSFRIQNFRSIRDASVKLGQVNLFIGPNNSGKSNFLKGIELAADMVRYYPNSFSRGADWFDSILSRGKHLLSEEQTEKFIKFRLDFENSEPLYFAYNYDGQAVALSSKFEIIYQNYIYKHLPALWEPFPPTISRLKEDIGATIIYKPDPIQFQQGAGISNATEVAADASNIVAYLFYLSQNHKARFRQLEHDLAQCVGNLVSISTPADPSEPGKLKLKFFDENDIGYWAEEVSEGVLYFLALLCIVHQPNPPKLLLLEEPEKGIHPRRIKEVMGFIFELARLRGIQIILTSHSPYVVDHFKDIPACVSVFDRDPETGETLIHNAQDLIDQTNAEYALQGLPPTDHTSSLGEYWVSGFLGGVPL